MNFERGYTMGSIFFEFLEAGGVLEALGLLTEKISSVATIIKLPELVLFILGAAVAVFVGCAGYKYIKLISTACFVVAGYGIGEALFETAKGHWSWNIPDFVGTVAGIVLLALLGYLAYKKFAYALFGVACFAGFMLAYYTYPNYLLAIAVGVIVAMLSMHFVRYAFVILTSFGSGCVLMAMIAAMFPQVTLLQQNEGFVGRFVTIVASLLFVAIQFYSTKGSGTGANKLHNGKKRVKIRRVFDVW